jgi:heat shock protein HslJ|tara:strand:- start:210 stop:638 length:429 start_codon:yes stop_codon:yes gene_type:complete
MKYTIALSILLFSLAIISCKETIKTIKNPSIDIYSGKYEIKSLNGNELSSTLSFTIETSENKISGKTNCNNYFGTYTISNANELKIGPLGATEMYCEEKVMKTERELFKAYKDSKTFSFDGKMLTLFNKEGTLLIRAYKISK